jgi:hypothetical protein
MIPGGPLVELCAEHARDTFRRSARLREAARRDRENRERLAVAMLRWPPRGPTDHRYRRPEPKRPPGWTEVDISAEQRKRLGILPLEPPTRRRLH